MGLLDRLFGKKLEEPPPPPPVAAPAPAPAPKPAPTFITPLEAIPGAKDALAAMKRGDRGPAERLYLGTRDSGFRYAFARQLGDDAPLLADETTPFDDLAQAEPMWHVVRGAYQIRVGWKARGGGTGDTVTREGAQVLVMRCEMAVNALEQAAALRPDDDTPFALMMGAARGLSDKDLGAHAYEQAVARNPNSWCAGFQRVEWLSPRWFGSIEQVLAYARAESKRVGTGDIAALPILAHNDLNMYYSMFQKDREKAAAARHAAADEIRDCVARSVHAPGAVPSFASTIIRHFAGSLLWQVADEAAAKTLLSKVGNTFEPWCWMHNEKAYANVRSRLAID